MRHIFPTKFLRAFVGRIRDRYDFDFGMFFKRRQMASTNDAARSHNSHPQFVIIFLRHASNPMISILRNGLLLRELNLTAACIRRSTFT